MPKEKELLQGIPRIYKRRYEDIAMFWYVRAQRSILPALSVEKCIENFYKEIGILNFNCESVRVTYQQMQNEYYEAAKETE